ncbi:hypothetical protein BSKO_11227 [Bryopsis sp. KO-2023]|nr:hypothetical protein BSKO_11227 [Bryopsis sp. KO-2023]
MRIAATRAPAPVASPATSSVSRVCHLNAQHGRRVACRAAYLGIGGMGDELTDFITAGRKMRRWYGQEDRMPKDGDDFGDEEPDPVDEEDEFDGEYIVVTESDSPTGELIILQLILNREKVKVLCQNSEAVKSAYGPYVTPVVGSTKDGQSVSTALKGAKCVICVGEVGEVASVAARKSVSNVVLISSVGVGQQKGFDFGSMFGEGATLADPKREEQIENCGVPYTILRCGKLSDSPGGISDLKLASSNGTQGVLSREDLGWVVAALAGVPNNARAVIEVVSGGPGSRPDDVEKTLQSLLESNVDA